MIGLQGDSHVMDVRKVLCSWEAFVRPGSCSISSNSGLKVVLIVKVKAVAKRTVSGDGGRGRKG